jgi:hypothetical protein
MSSEQPNLAVLVQSAQREILDTYRKESEQLASAFRDLDTKAQGAATLAGGFLAASLAFLNRRENLSIMPVRGILVISILGLVGAIVFAILALRIRTLAASPSGEDVRKLLAKIASDKNEQTRTEGLTYFYGDAAELWRGFVENRRRVNEEKAKYIWSAQKCLLLTALSVSLILVLILLNYQ